MQYFLLCFGSMLMNATTSTPRDPHKLTTVLDHTIAQTLYRRVRHEMLDDMIQSPLDEIDIDTKNKICHHITGSAYYSNIYEEKRVYVHQMYDKIKEDAPTLFEWLYEPYGVSTSDGPMVYTNRTSWIDVHHVAENDQMRSLPEEVFVCLTIRERGDQESVMVYYVSRQYNLSDTPNPYIAGRFVFAESAADPGQIEIYNVAEEPAKSFAHSSADAELLYLAQKADNEPEESEEDDPLCSLSQPERLRVCAQVLSSAYFEVDLKFTPNFDFVDASSECVLSEISFRDGRSGLEAGKRLYQEWLISCRPDQYYASYQAEYFLSRVYSSSNEVFAYRWDQDSKIVIENLFSDVRFRI